MPLDNFNLTKYTGYLITRYMSNEFERMCRRQRITKTVIFL